MTSISQHEEAETEQKNGHKHGNSKGMHGTHAIPIDTSACMTRTKRKPNSRPVSRETQKNLEMGATLAGAFCRTWLRPEVAFWLFGVDAYVFLR